MLMTAIRGRPKKFASCQGGWGGRSCPRLTRPIHSVDRTPDIPTEWGTLYHWAILILLPRTTSRAGTKRSCSETLMRWHSPRNRCRSSTFPVFGCFLSNTTSSGTWLVAGEGSAPGREGPSSFCAVCRLSILVSLAPFLKRIKDACFATSMQGCGVGGKMSDSHLSEISDFDSLT